MNKLNKLSRPFFVLAPMDDVTDTVFRQIIADCAPPELYFTEFVNVDGLQSPGRQNLLKKLKFTDKETPLIAQIWGKNPENYYKTVKELKDGTLAKEANNGDAKTNYIGVDINMGCPVKTVIKSGCCSALIDNRGLAGEIIAAAKEAAGDLPVSVKTRIGIKNIDLSWFEFLLEQKLNMLTIHGRTQKEMSKVPAHWDVIGQCREIRDSLSPTTLIVGNGDVMSRKQGEKLAEQYKLDGIMIGRGVFHDPYMFENISGNQSTWELLTKKDKLSLYTKHVKLFADTWLDAERKIATLNKFCKIYVNDFPAAKELREKLMNASTINQLLHLIEKENS